MKGDFWTGKSQKRAVASIKKKEKKDDEEEE
jgi:hypothetical protein